VNAYQSPTLMTSCNERSDATISRLLNLLIFRTSDSGGKRGFWATRARLAVRLDASFTTRCLDDDGFDFDFDFTFDGGGDGDGDGESASWLLRKVCLVVGAMTRYNVEKQQVNLTWQDHLLIKLIDGN